MGPDPALVRAIERLRAKVAPAIPIERVILFGSRARGDARPRSDTDLIVVSRAFEGKTASRRAAPLYRAWEPVVPVDFLCYTPQEFERLAGKPSIVSVALEEGVEIQLAA